MHLAEANAILALGCTKTYTASKLAKAGRPLPWVLGLGPSTVIAEPWSHIHKLHRRKRGFRAVCDRLKVLLASARSMPDCPTVVLQVWEDEATIDGPLLEKVGRQLDQPISIVGAVEIQKALALVRTSASENLHAHHNPILAVLGWLSAQDC